MIKIYNDKYQNIDIKENEIDLLYLDPPYNVKDKHWENKEDNYWDFLYNLFEYYYPKIKDTSTIWLFNEWQNTGEIMEICNCFGFHIIMPIIWSRSSPGKAGRRYKMNYEIIWWIVADKNNYVFNRQHVQMKGKQVLSYYKKDGTPRGWYYDENGIRTRNSEIGSVWLYPENKMPKVLESDGLRKRVEGINNIWFDTRPFWSMPEKNITHLSKTSKFNWKNNKNEH